MSSARRRDLAMGGIMLLVVVLDQLSKHWIVGYFIAPGVKPPIDVVGTVLDIEYVQNYGAAFSLFSGQARLFVFIAAAVAVIGYLYWRTREHGSLPLKLSFGLVLGGALGNLIDRFSHQYVVDFVHFHVGTGFDFAVFNVADSAISVGVVVLAFLLWRGTDQGAEATHSAATTPIVGAQTPTPAQRAAGGERE